MQHEPMSSEPNFESSNIKKVTQQWNIKTILIAFMLLSLLGTWGYIIWDKNNTKDILQQKDANTASLTQKRNSLQKDLEDITNRFNQIKLSNVQKDSVIIIRDQEISSKQNRISYLLNKQHTTEGELAEARKLIESLKMDIDGYISEINSLKLKNSELNSMNDKLVEQRDRVRRDYDSSLNEIKNRDNVIDVGSTLHASNFNITPLDERRSGKIVETSKARKVDKLRISFDIDENMIAPSGAKKIYIIMTDPGAKVISDAQNGTSNFKTREGDVKVYTQMMEINYTQNKRQTISFDWNGSGKFENGTYKIEVYHNGYKIGEGLRPLKK